MADLGARLTGNEDEEEGPLKSIVSGAGNALNKAIFDDPASRSALLQIGLQLMQPMALGQSAAGHFGQGVGAGGEAVGRIEAADLEAEKERNRAENYEERLRIAQQNADTRAANSGQDKISSSVQAGIDQNNRQAAIAHRRERKAAISTRAATIDKEVNSLTGPINLPGRETHPWYKKYHGKPLEEIEKMVEAEDIAENGPLPSGLPGTVVAKPPIRVGKPQTTSRTTDDSTESIPPVKDRKLGVTRYKGHVWGKDASGKVGWVPDDGEE
jgi:hypothetical protein